jgi:subtilisin family serine protease
MQKGGSLNPTVPPPSPFDSSRQFQTGFPTERIFLRPAAPNLPEQKAFLLLRISGHENMKEAKMARSLVKSEYTLKSVALGVLSIFLFLCLPGTFAWSAEVVGKEKQERWKQNEVLYKLKSTAGFERINLIKSELDAYIDEEIAEIEFDTIRRLRSRSKNTEELIQRLMRNPHVLYAEPNYVISIDKTPNDPSYGSLWGLPKISAPSAWDVTTGTGAVVVGVVDSGVDYNHPDLAANIWSNSGVINGCPANTRGFNAITRTCDPMDDNNHGTHVSGTIGAVGNNATGVAGVNWTTRIMGLKTLDSTGSGTTANAIAAIDWAVTAKQAGVNVRVLNASWGSNNFSQALLDEINKAATNDILFVAAAGNDNVNNDVTPNYPSGYGTPNKIAVAATTSTDGLASFSNYGANSVDLGAPGASILSTTRNNTYSTFSGTSMATPHVSGAAALILSACSQATVNGVKSLILSNVDPLASLSGKVNTGGRLNVNKAIQSCSVPPAPANLSATAVSVSQINLTWTDQSANETGFQVERKTGAGGTYAQIGTTAANTTTYNDTGLAEGTMYFYRVRAINGNGNSAYSSEASATPVSPPVAPANLSATAVSSSQINLSWTDQSTNETGFQIERKTGAGGTYTLIGTTTANATTYNNTGRAEGTTYFYRLRAVNSAGNSAYSNEASATTPFSPPVAPANLSATVISVSQINLSWTVQSTNETGFQIERKTGAGGTYTLTGTTTANATTYNNTGLAEGAMYFYRVRAVNSAGNSAYSNEVSATTPVSPPAAPANLSATAVSSSQINLSWTDQSANETGFQIERKTGAGGAYAQIGTATANTMTHNDTGLAEGTAYFYRVRAVNGGGNSAFSNEASATPVSPPAAPANLSATVISVSQINLTWTDQSANETGIQIERKTGAGGAYALIVTTAPNTTTYSNSGLAEGTAYFYRVRAVNSAGNSGYSNEASATTLVSPPAAPANLSATAVSVSQINLSWTDQSINETGFQIERKNGAGGTYAQIVTTTAPNVTTYSDSGLLEGTTYFYRVRAVNDGGNSAYFNEASSTTLSSGTSGGGGGGGCSISPEWKSKGESPLGTMLALLLPGIFLVVRKTLHGK